MERKTLENKNLNGCFAWDGVGELTSILMKKKGEWFLNTFELSFAQKTQPQAKGEGGICYTWRKKTFRKLNKEWVFVYNGVIDAHTKLPLMPSWLGTAQQTQLKCNKRSKMV